MLRGVSQLNNPSSKYPELTELQEHFYLLNSDLQIAFNSDTHTNWIAEYIHWWNNYYIKPKFNVENLSQTKTKDLINLVGFARGDLGLGEDLRLASKSLDIVGSAHSIFNIDYPAPHRNKNNEVADKISDNLPGKISIFQLPPTELYKLVYSHSVEVFNRTYNIAYSPWELDSWPADYSFCFDFVDEVWGISKYTTDCYEKSLKKSVYHMPLSLDFPNVSDVDVKLKYGIPENKFTYLIMFDLNSSIHRKNPLAAYEAFRQAFDGSDAAILVVKTFGEPVTEYDKKIFSHLKQDSRVYFIQDTLSKSEVNKLIQQSDCYISLHRAEGFGRIMAEAMLLNTSVVATAYSGNMDFMDEGNSYLVDYNLIKVKKNEYHFVFDNLWADPIVESAKQQIIKVFQNHDDVQKKKSLAFENITNNFSNSSLGKKMTDRLNQIKVTKLELKEPVRNI